MMKNRKRETGCVVVCLIVAAIFGLTSCSDEDESSISVKAPVVDSVSPADGSTGVNRDTGMSITFNESMDTDNIELNSTDTTCSGSIQVSTDDFATCLVLNDSYNGDYPYRIVTFRAFNRLAAETTHKIKVSKEVTDRAGEGLVEDYVMTTGFTTGTAGSTTGVTLTLIDEDMDEDEIAGTLTLTKATDESVVDEYRIYWGSSSTEKLAGQDVIETYTADGTDKSETLDEDSAVPDGATHLLVYAVYEDIESAEPVALDIPDGVCRMVKDINGSGGGSVGNITPFNDKVVFNANDGTNGMELWISDGTDSGTEMILDINSGTADTNPSKIAVDGTTLYFGADTAAEGRELWKSDGTNTGTSLVKDFFTGTSSGFFEYPVVMDGNVFFQGMFSTSLGSEFCISDGSAAGTVTLKNINTNPNGGSNPVNFLVLGSMVYFNASDGTNGVELWKSDGSGG